MNSKPTQRTCSICKKGSAGLWHFHNWDMDICFTCISAFQLGVSRFMGRDFIDTLPKDKVTFFHLFAPNEMWRVEFNVATSLDWPSEKHES